MKIVGGIRWLVRLEIGIWRSLFLWLTRRVPGDGTGVRTFSYARQLVPILTVIVFVSLLELVVVHLLLPWATVRIVLLVVSVWGLLWMLGFLASMKVFPHLIDDAGLRIRYGTTTDIRVPWEAVASVGARRRSVATGKTVDLERGDEGTVANVAVMKQTRVDVVLHGPTAIELPAGTEELTGVRFYADDARAFVAAAHERHADRGTARR